MRFDFNLALDAPGWADPVIEHDERRLSMTASYLTDALGDLLDALIQLVNGWSSAGFEWTEEPAGWRWTLHRPDQECVDVTIRYRLDAMSPLEPPDEYEARFHVQLELGELVDAVSEGARRCLAEHGPEGYALQWQQHPFPTLQLEALERWAIARQVAPLYQAD